ncbi:hypothetical protein BU16DRAFT_250072 [Lophium mytilinum]|uniref:Uncharacterized protein n=1 Tax=Lophium mytilinum TaxID=390894 RepID=A0A6A6R7U1_9PEZI|nr:hypothetical protein BU16DRAFT_250072 [Lophium mytilinum]
MLALTWTSRPFSLGATQCTGPWLGVSRSSTSSPPPWLYHTGTARRRINTCYPREHSQRCNLQRQCSSRATSRLTAEGTSSPLDLPQAALSGSLAIPLDDDTEPARVCSCHCCTMLPS